MRDPLLWLLCGVPLAMWSWLFIAAVHSAPPSILDTAPQALQECAVERDGWRQQYLECKRDVLRLEARVDACEATHP